MTIEAIRERLEARAIAAPAKLAEERKRNRELYPDVGLWLDQWERFGKLPRGRFVTPTGVIEWGTRGG